METVGELKEAGNKLFKAGKYDEAVEKYSDALAIDPENHLLHSNRSLAHCSNGNYEAAIGDAVECLRLNPSFVKGYYRLAAAQISAGRTDEAAKTLEKGLKLDPSNTELKKLGRQIAAKPRKALDEATQKEAQELSELISSKRRELQATQARAQMCRRETKSLELTISEVEGVEEDSTLYRAVGKAFLLEPRSSLLDVLSAQLKSSREAGDALASRYDTLGRDIQSTESDLKALVQAA